MDDRQKRAVIAVVSIFAGGIALIVLLIVLSSGGDDTKSVNTASDRTTTTSSSTTTTSTLPPTTTTFAPLTVPPTAPPPPAPTVIVIPPTAAPTTAATVPPTTTPTAPTTTTTTPSPSQQLAATIETALNGGVPPDPGAPKRVKVTIPANPDNPDKRIDVDWDLDPTLTPVEQAAKAREEALLILAAVRDANLPGEQEIRVRGFVPDPDDPEDRLRVVRLIYERATIDGAGFPTYENVFEEPPALVAEIDILYVPPAPPTTSTSSTTTTTT